MAKQGTQKLKSKESRDCIMQTVEKRVITISERDPSIFDDKVALAMNRYEIDRVEYRSTVVAQGISVFPYFIAHLHYTALSETQVGE